jgi:hypothetical protein
MKLEIDLTDVLYDENGNQSETLAESIRRQVIEVIKQDAAKDIKRQISEAVNIAIDTEMRDAIKDRMPGIVDELMDTEYQPVSNYGAKSPPTTFRKQLLAGILSEMTYKKANYDSDKNAFTKAVDATVNAQLHQFSKEFQKTIDAEFTRQALATATEALRKRLGVA